MRTIKSLARLLIGSSLFLFSGNIASADVIYDYTISNGFYHGVNGLYDGVNGGLITGTIDFDATTGFFIAANIQTSGMGNFSTINANSEGHLLLYSDSSSSLQLQLNFDNGSGANFLLGLPETIGFDSYFVLPLGLSGTMGGSLTVAVPEISTWVMMIFGFCGLSFLAHRKRAAQDKRSRPVLCTC